MTVELYGFKIDPCAGIVIGKRGRPVGAMDRAGYINVGVWIKGRTHHFKLHRLIWESVHGPIGDGLEINHINGVKHDNAIANLELVTSGENKRHAYRYGLAHRRQGEMNPFSKLSAEIVTAIRTDKITSSRELARRYGVNKSTILRARSGRRWQCVEAGAQL